MLLGTLCCAADHETGLRLPPEFRAELAAGLVITRGIERCLYVFPIDTWDELVQKMRRRLQLTNRTARDFTRLMFSSALTCTPDGGGRIPLPDDLREYAGIEHRAVAVGLHTHIEVWDADRWEEMNEQIAREALEIAERLGEQGI
jgi:MraZ protein